MSAYEEDGVEFQALLKDLPQEKNLLNGICLYNYQGFWVPQLFLKGQVAAQKKFVALYDDILLASCPKSGTTWLKALVFSIVNRTSDHSFTLSNSPLLKKIPHEVVPNLEYGPAVFQSPNSNANDIRIPRIFGTHIPYESLPTSTKTSGCKIVCIHRNPMDQLISFWHFGPQFGADDARALDLEEWFEKFCSGIHVYGPFWDHVLGYWKASLENPGKILMLKYEDLKLNPVNSVMRLAEFLGFPFSVEEEKNGVVEEILDFCSIGKMKALEVNKNGKRPYGVPHSAYFRKGDVGDSKNFLTPRMVERMEKLMQEKYGHHYLALQ